MKCEKSGHRCRWPCSGANDFLGGSGNACLSVKLNELNDKYIEELDFCLESYR